MFYKALSEILQFQLRTSGLFPRDQKRGLIEAILPILLPLLPRHFRAIKSAVTLKHLLVDLKTTAKIGFPRDQKRGLMEGSTGKICQRLQGESPPAQGGAD